MSLYLSIIYYTQVKIKACGRVISQASSSVPPHSRLCKLRQRPCCARRGTDGLANTAATDPTGG